MSDSESPFPPRLGPAPADARAHRPWPLGRKILAYVILLMLALASIWYIDRKVHRPTITSQSAAPSER